MADLSPWRIPGTTGYIIYLRDSSIPRGVKAFIRRDSRVSHRCKIRVKDDARVLTAIQKQSILAMLHDVANEVSYNFDELLKKMGC